MSESKISPPNLRYMRTQQLVAQIMELIGGHLCDHNDPAVHRHVHDEIFEAFYNAGVEVVTDETRRSIGLPQRDATGWTPEELRLLEVRRLQEVAGLGVTRVLMGDDALPVPEKGE